MSGTATVLLTHFFELKLLRIPFQLPTFSNQRKLSVSAKPLTFVLSLMYSSLRSLNKVQAQFTVKMRGALYFTLKQRKLIDNSTPAAMSGFSLSTIDFTQLQRVLQPLIFTATGILVTTKVVRWLFFRKIHTKTLKDNSRINEFIVNDQLLPTPSNDLQKLQDCVYRGYHLSGNGRMLGYRPKNSDGSYGDYVWLSYGEVSDLKFSVSLIEVIESAEKLSKLMASQTHAVPARAAIMYKNQPKFVICELACYMAGITVVPLYATLGYDAMKSILEEIDPYWFIAETEAEVKELLKLDENNNKQRAALFMENRLPTAASEDQWWNDRRTTLCSFGNSIKVEIQMNDGKPLNTEEITPEDFCMICYTSGTTGRPKGAILTHRNILAATTADMLIKTPILSEVSVHLCYKTRLQTVLD
uniref:long-chain-fatty-acid--CoA ligase n=1 Tax=Syphacia muris TaxID=451379 RepID=A0A0N5AS75_9BILA